MGRWLWRAVVGLWILVGILVLPTLFAIWRSNPSDDLDFGPMAQVFGLALLAWSAVALAMLVGWLLYKAAKKEAALRAADEYGLVARREPRTSRGTAGPARS